MAVATGAPFGFLTSKGDRVEGLRLQHPSLPEATSRLGLSGPNRYPHASTEARKWLNLAKMAEMSHIGSCNFSAGLAFK
jgi:hypothetical protein